MCTLDLQKQIPVLKHSQHEQYGEACMFGLDLQVNSLVKIYFFIPGMLSMLFSVFCFQEHGKLYSKCAHHMSPNIQQWILTCVCVSPMFLLIFVFTRAAIYNFLWVHFCRRWLATYFRMLSLQAFQFFSRHNCSHLRIFVFLMPVWFLFICFPEFLLASPHLWRKRANKFLILFNV